MAASGTGIQAADTRRRPELGPSSGKRSFNKTRRAMREQSRSWAKENGASL
jgi:hypothetical protein